MRSGNYPQALSHVALVHWRVNLLAGTAAGRPSSCLRVRRSRSPTPPRSSGRSSITKLDLVSYYVSVAEGAVRGLYGRPQLLKRFPNGIEQEAFFQTRAGEAGPTGSRSRRSRFSPGRHADEVVVRNVAQLAWIINLGCIDLNAHPVRKEDMNHPG